MRIIGILVFFGLFVYLPIKLVLWVFSLGFGSDDDWILRIAAVVVTLTLLAIGKYQLRRRFTGSEEPVEIPEHVATAYVDQVAARHVAQLKKEKRAAGTFGQRAR